MISRLDSLYLAHTRKKLLFAVETAVSITAELFETMRLTDTRAVNKRVNYPYSMAKSTPK